MRNNIHYTLNTYLRRLSNLSHNNRSLFLPRLKSDHFIDLHNFNHLSKEKSFSLIENLLKGRKKTLCPIVDSRVESSNEISKKIKRLQRIDHLIFEEHGTRDLHVGWPFVRGMFMEGNPVRCPLLFIPVVLYAEHHSWIIKPRDNEPVIFNKSFLLAYSFHNKVSVAESLLEEFFEDTDRESTSFRTTLYRLLKNSDIDIHFNPDNYRDELIPFQPFTKQEFFEQHKNGKLKLFPEAVLGIFPQAGSHLAPDYIELIEKNAIESLEAFFASKQHTGHPYTAATEEKNILTGYTQDVWQESILKALKAGRSVIAKGPPGTGKSQLICNVICDALATGKRVLVVCQKRAALDVVYERLKKLGLSDFAALVHDFKSDRKEIYAKAKKQIERVEEYTTQNNSLDAIQMNRIFLRTGNRIDQIIKELEEFKKALFDDSECGMSIHELYLHSNPHGKAIDIKEEYKNFSLDSVDAFITKLKTYCLYAASFEQEHYLWKDRKSFAALRISDARKIENILQEIPSSIHHLCDQIKAETGSTVSWEQCDSLWEKKKELLELTKLLADPPVYHHFQYFLKKSVTPDEIKQFTRIEKSILDCFKEVGPEIHTPSDRLNAVQHMLEKYMNVRNRPIAYIQWFFFSKDKKSIKKTLRKHGLRYDNSGIKTLVQMLNKRIDLERHISLLKDTFRLAEVPEKYEESTIKKWLNDEKSALRAMRIFLPIRNIHPIINPVQITYENMADKVKKILDILAVMIVYKSTWSVYLSDSEIHDLVRHPDKCMDKQTALRKDFDALCEFDTIRKNLLPQEKSSIEKLHHETGTWAFPVLQELFLNSLFLAWIDHIETLHPLLRIVSSGKIDLLEGELAALVQKKQKISTEIIRMRAREQVTQNLEFNRLKNRTTYRDLLHQLTKKKRIWPIRKIITHFEEDIFKLVPCWMVSPECASAILPLKQVVDMVIFDEASQCFAERGIPAMYRGHQILIAGDDKQLQPHDIYRIRWQDEEESPDTEIDSLLGLAERHLVQLPLRGHYRSTSLALIDFSNRLFYDGQLTLLPDFDHYIQTEKPIAYHKIDGLWENQVNLIEAQEVAQKAAEFVQHNPSKEIGIVTFNAPQQMLVMDIIEETFSKKGISIPPSLIVKNIENVQGDEKDIIIFSIGYAPDKKGKFKAQFGSLNREGGENRLNVAITRAREKIVIITSIWPEQLHVEESRNDGPKLLKEYLRYAMEISEGRFSPFIKQDDKTTAGTSLKSRLQAWGAEHFPTLAFRCDVLPFADVSVHTNDKKVDLILTDDTLYHQSPSAKDMHVFTPDLLRKKEWRHLRVYSRNYWQNRTKFLEHIARFISA